MMVDTALQIMHLSESVTEAQLRSLFEVFGEIVSIQLKRGARNIVGVVKYSSRYAFRNQSR